MFSDRKTSAVFHSNRYSAESSCRHCGGVVRHENWCITRDALVLYAYEAVLNPTKLTAEDALRLHGMGVAWTAGGCFPGESGTDRAISSK